jgi:hypothetical protein
MEKRGKYLRVYLFDGPDDPKVEEEWNKIYDAEHVPLVVHHRSEVIRGYRYVALEREGNAPKYLTVYELDSPEQTITPEGAEQIRTHHITRLTMPSRGTGRGVYRQIYPEE